MRSSDRLFNAASSVRDDAGADGIRRMLLMTPLIASWPACDKDQRSACQQDRSIGDHGHAPR